MSIASDFAAAVTSGPLLLAAPVAAAAGLVSFLSPCCLPLVPGYLSFVTGLSGADLEQVPAVPVRQLATVGGRADTEPVAAPTAARQQHRGRVAAGSILFVLGFSAVFVSEGAFFGAAGVLLLSHQRGVEIVLGALTVLMGLSFLGLVPGLQREMRIRRLPKVGLAGAPLLGVVFGVGWTPCLGPTLAAVQALAYTQGSAGRGALLTVAYCLGLGLPFIATGLAFQRALRVFAVVRRHYAFVTRTGGAMLIIIGVLLITGEWTQLTIHLRIWVAGYQTSV
jgi:cytochrome c-type biogenesis protein